jgi:hypothetical protein
MVLLNKGGSRGLATDFYIPHQSQEGYESFISGYNVTDKN